MLSDSPRENYNRKLDEIIDFFKTEKETWTFYSYIGKEDSKFSLNVILSAIVILLAVSTTLSDIDTAYKKFTLIIIAVSLILLGLYMILDLKSSKERNYNIIDKTINFNSIISFLQSLKILPYEVDLSKLVNKIKYYYHLDTIYSVKDGKYMSETWLKEVEVCLNEINKEIFEKEGITSLQK